MRKLRVLEDVVDWRLCIGCGACASICPAGSVRLRDLPNEGIRPYRIGEDCGTCSDCMQVCPAVQSDFGLLFGGAAATDPFEKEWGRVLEIWEGHATDPEIRYQGSSGGALTALGAYCLEQLGMAGVLHVGQDPADPVKNTTRFSRSREELLAASGSRYSPASVCDGLLPLAEHSSPSVVIGKPGEISAVRNAEKLRPELAAKVGLTMSFFCAESPSTNGTLALLDKMQVPATRLRDLRYRGNGWPGHFAPVQEGETQPTNKLTYRESWAFLQAFRPWSVHLWPDGSGELADISCGDPWYEEPDGQNPGFSMIVVRTPKGREIVRRAMEDGYLTLRSAERWKLSASQAGLLTKKGAVAGRRAALRFFAVPVPHFKGSHLLHCWMRLPYKEKLKSTIGTVKRILLRGYYSRSRAVRS